MKIKNMRRLRYGTTSTAVTAAVVAIVLLLNILVSVLADKFPLSFDLSDDQVYTISDESIAVAEKVEEDLEIVVFLGEENFTNPTSGTSGGVPEYDTLMREFYNLLKQYRSHSDNHVSYSFINPDQDPAKYAAYTTYEPAVGDVLFLSKTSSRKFSVNDLYSMDTSNYYATGSYEFESKAEKMMASTINNLIGGNQKTVQVLIGHEEDSKVIDGLKALYELNGYTFENNTITGSTDFNKDAEVMLIAAPKKDYSASEIQRVQQWLYNEGNYNRNLMVFVDATADCPNLYEFLRIEYGLYVTDEIILETDYSRVQDYNPLLSMCDIPETDFTKNSAGTGTVFAPVSRRIVTSLETYDAESNLGQFSTELTNFPSSSRLVTLEDYTSEATDKSDKVYEAEENAYPLSSMIVCLDRSYNNDTGKKADTDVVLCGSVTMAYDSYISDGTFRNEELLLDTINTMAEVEQTLSISNKKLSEDTVYFNGNVQLIVGGIFIVALPLIILITCLVVFLRRKHL